MHAHEPSRPITRADARRLGIPTRQLAGPSFQRVFYDQYLPAEIKVGTFQRASASLRIAPAGSYVSHHTAATLWGACAPVTAETHLSVPGNAHRSRRQGIRAHRAIEGRVPARFRGLMISRPVDVFLDMAGVGTDLVELVVLGDSLVRAERTTPDELVTAADGWSGKGARRARSAARWVREGVDSASESRLRMLIVLAGLPEPEVNYRVRRDDGQPQLRFDLCYPTLKLIVEYDGRQHIDDRKQWSRDLLRREQLERQGWRFLIINADALYGHPVATFGRIREALADRGCQHLPRCTPPAWSRHFAADGL